MPKGIHDHLNALRHLAAESWHRCAHRMTASVTDRSRIIKKVPIVVVLSLFCAVVGVGLNSYLRREPYFEGRPFSDWIWTMNAKPTGPEKEKARAVVRQLGSNSVPLLLRWIRKEDRPSLAVRYEAWRNGIYSWLMNHKLLKRGPITTTHFDPSHRAMAVWAFADLDPVSKKTAVAALIPLLGDKGPDTNSMSLVAGSAFMALSTMAPESIDPLIHSLTNRDIQAWALACGALGRIGPQAKSAIPVMEQWLWDRDPQKRLCVAENIGELGGDPGAFVPVVIQTLPELGKDLGALDFALQILAKHKEHASNATPVLVRMAIEVSGLTNAGDVMVRRELIGAMGQISPGAVAEEERSHEAAY